MAINFNRILISLLLVGLIAPMPTASAEATEDVMERFSLAAGEDNIPAGCLPFHIWGESPLFGVGGSEYGYVDNPCHQMGGDMNSLDTPKIDVLILVPASPTAERDLRVMRQSIEMWADGVEWMAADMGLQWLAEGVEFHVSAEIMNPAGESEAEFTTYPIVDPEIVVIASNPVGGLGIGIDALGVGDDFTEIVAREIFGDDVGDAWADNSPVGACHGIQNPFDMELWQNLPGFDSHHDGRGGTYVEDCDGAGGDICFAINGAIDPETNTMDFFQLYDLVSHEFGHCMTIGHVGDGAEGDWASVPRTDIMSYDSEPEGLSKCISSLDVEMLVIPMSRYLDTNGDGEVNEMDHIFANDAEGEGDGRPFMIQHPDNHYYASPTRMAKDCPQPDFSPVPLSEVRNFTPEAMDRHVLHITNLDEFAVAPQGYTTIAGTAIGDWQTAPREATLPAPTVSHADEAGDSNIPHYDILQVDASMDDETLEVVVTQAAVRDEFPMGSFPQYTLRINGEWFNGRDSNEYFERDTGASTLTYTFSRESLASDDNGAITAPYQIRAVNTNFNVDGQINFDYAPNWGAPAVLVGETPEVADAPYVLLTVNGTQNISAPVNPDGSWSGNVDLSEFPDANTTFLSATWYTPNGFVIDSDRVHATVDASLPVDEDTVRNAGAGPGALGTDSVDGEKKTPVGVLPILAVAIGALAMAIRRRQN